MKFPSLPQPPSLDTLISTADKALRSIFAPARAARPLPVPRHEPGHGADFAAGNTPADGPTGGLVAATTPTEDLSDAERRESAALMRVNHTGEVAAQALYHGQAFVARSEKTREMLLLAAREETDHLAWCETRLSELQSRTSFLNPLWYVGSFAIGAVAATFGDRVSLGFVAETERQVEGHLDSHLERLSQKDLRSRAIVEAMRTDEISHGMAARAAGGAELPAVARELMKHTSRVMTHTAYWI
jgi:ubiquinone biosynthesis monooxygenase Coq7